MTLGGTSLGAGTLGGSIWGVPLSSVGKSTQLLWAIQAVVGRSVQLVWGVEAVSIQPPSVIFYHLFDEGQMDILQGYQLFYSFLPDDPDNAIAIFDTSGRLDGRLMRTGEQIEHYGIQIQVRGRDYVEAWRLANTIATYLDSLRKEVVVTEAGDAYILHNVSRSGAVIPIGVETVNTRLRRLFSINMTVTLSREN